MIPPRALSRNAVLRLPAHCRSALFSHKSIIANQLSSTQFRKTLSSFHHLAINRSRSQTCIASVILKRHTTTSSSSSADDDKNSTPTYKLPNTGFLSLLPAPLVPYAELARMDKPIGTVLLFLPCLFSTFLAAPFADPVSPQTTLLLLRTIFTKPQFS